MDQGIVERVRSLLRQDIDWERLISLALRNRVISLLYSSLNKNDSCRDLVPEAIMKRLERHFKNNVARSYHLTMELFDLLDLFESQGIPAIPFKGPILSASVYGNVYFREFGDIDILIQKRDVSEARNLLISRGFRSKRHRSASNEATHMETECAIGFVRDRDQVFVDLQWGATLLSYFSYSTDSPQFWERLETFSIAGKTVPSIPPEDLLQLLCVHGSRHSWERLGWICDVAELVNAHPEIDWGLVLRQAENQGNRRKLLLGLFLAHELLDALVPADVLSRAHNEVAIQSLAAQVRHWIMSEPYNRANGIDEYVFRLRLMERMSDKLAYSFHLARHHVAPNARDRATIQLPTSLSFLYYLIRPTRLVCKYGMRSLKLIFGHRAPASTSS